VRGIPFAAVFVAMVVVAIVALICQLDSLPASANQILAADGMTNIKLTGWQWFACGADDSVNTGFEGLKNGHYVKGVVCGAWNKGYTVRYLP